MAIPDIFHSFLHDGPFKSCSMCERPFSEFTQYMVEKAYVKNEVIFEYALCDPCTAKIRADLSLESVAAINSFFAEAEERRAKEGPFLHVRRPGHPEDWISRCLLTGQHLKECDRYQICGFFRGPDMLVGEMPCMISGDAIEGMQERLSKRTRDCFDDFTRDVLGLPPDLADLPMVMV